MCVCSHSYPARTANAPYYTVICDLSGSTTLFHIILLPPGDNPTAVNKYYYYYYLMNDTIFV